MVRKRPNGPQAGPGVSKGAFSGLAERAVTASGRGSQRDGERQQLKQSRDPHSFIPLYLLGSCDKAAASQVLGIESRGRG